MNDSVRKAAESDLKGILQSQEDPVVSSDIIGNSHSSIFDPEFQGVIDRISSGHFSNGDRDLFKPLVDSLLFHDTFMLFADFGAYVDVQKKVDEAYRDQEHWTRMSILNAARMGKFSSDRAIREYCREIWKVKPVPVVLDPK